MRRSAEILCAAMMATGLIAAGVSVTKAENHAPELSIPIPVGHHAEGVRFPYHDERGTLKMDFSIQSAYRVDDSHLQMKLVKLLTYDDSGKLEMTIDMPSSILDLRSRIVISDEPVMIRRADFEITGDTMQFDTQTHSGKIVGKVKMLIFNSIDIGGPGAK